MGAQVESSVGSRRTGSENSPPPLARAEALVPLVEERALEGERARQTHREVIDALRAAGLFHLVVPQALGGGEHDLITLLEVIERISRADGSTGWITMILNGSFMAAWLDPAVATEIMGDGDFILAGTFGPLGQAVRNGDGFTVNGRWPFNSGSPHASWMLGGIFVMGDDGPVMVGDGRPDWRFAMFPADQCEIHDTWHASGLRATSSHDISVAGLRVPEELMIAPLFEPARHDGPLWRFSFFALISAHVAGVPLGIARRALDEAVELCHHKSRGGAQATLIQDPAVQMDLARCETKLRSVRGLVVDAIGTAWETAVAGDPVTVDQRVGLRMAVMEAAHTGVEVVDRCFRLGGGGALYEGSPLQRCWRDLHAATHHIFFSDQHFREVAAVHLGVAKPTYFI